MARIDPDALHPDIMVARARVARSLASSALVEGSVDPSTLASYTHWLAVSVLLGDVDIDVAAHSLDRARQVFDANLYNAAQVVKRLTPPHNPK
jgi:hypothetical protein